MPPITSQRTTAEVLHEIGVRLEEYRLQQNRSTAALAADAGLSRATVQHLEDGQSVTLESFVRILRALGRVESIEAMLPPPAVSPIDLARRRGHVRLRARTRPDGAA